MLMKIGRLLAMIVPCMVQFILECCKSSGPDRGPNTRKLQHDNVCGKNITDNCILGLDYLKAHKAVIDLSQGVLVVNDTIVKESISTQKVP